MSYDANFAKKNSTFKTHDASQAILLALEEIQQGSGFGSIEIILHEGRVTQIEKREKYRFTQDAVRNTLAPHSIVK
ncbi:MAG: DUF2292 domain-containing protein [Betaproteobacteria bacterium HGW-Betaproteobacteria-22]|nr:MAG: DUF2292 domain-containing protein [Betaproteobacteria bacterium HGW-Betaproteobacteria-22]